MHKRPALLTPVASVRRHAPLVAWAIAWCLLALFVYRPFQPRPFDVLDFSEFLPILQRASGWSEKVVELTAYYASQGRLGFTSYALLAGKWMVFGDQTVLWQLARCVQMGAVALLLYLLLRRWGATVLGSALASTLVLCSQTAAPAWVRVTAAEPLGTMVVLGAMLLASHYNASARKGTIGIALLLSLLILSFLKEMFLAAWPGVLAMSVLVSPDGTWSARRPDRSHYALIVSSTALIVLCAIPILYVASHAPATAYATLYGSAGVSIGDAVFSYLTILIPFVPFVYPANVGVLGADLGFVLLLLIGWRLYFRNAGSLLHARLLLLFGLAFPLACVVAYLPWPGFQPFYGLPFIMGPAVLVAFAVTGAQRAGGRASVAAGFAWTMVTAVMLTSSHLHARRAEAGLRTSLGVIDALKPLAGSDSVLFAVKFMPRRSWFGLGPTLRRQAMVAGTALPPVRDMLCDEARTRLSALAAGTVMVVFRSHCGDLAPAQQHVTFRFERFDWGRLRVVGDSVRADVVVR